MQISQKDRSLLLLIAAVLVIFWAVYSLFSNIFFSAAFQVSDISKITSNKEVKWLNVSRPLEKSDLKDRVILLDFWTYACVSCIENIPEIKKLEKEFGNKLAVIGVHSGKFENEKDLSSIKKAILRYDITHPVLQDAEMKVWHSFKVKAWPTLILINPHGNIVKTYSAEDDFETIHRDVKKQVAKFKYEIKREALPITLEKYDLVSNVLSFPTKLEYAAEFSYKSAKAPALLIANTGKNNIIASNMLGGIITKIGSGKEGFEDGSFDVASFRFPQGLLYSDNKLYVADSGNHALRVIDFMQGSVSTLIGSGKKGKAIEVGRVLEAKDVELSSPSDIEFFPDRKHIVIANAGSNQILSFDIDNNSISVLAGNGSKGNEDGEDANNSLAQTSDMSSYNGKLYFIDSDSSSLRVLDEKGAVKTLIGQGLAKFGHANGQAKAALMQHPLGLMVDDTGAYISDSFNHAIRKYDFASGQIRDLAGFNGRGESLGSKTQFNEPDGIISVIDRFYIADSNNNRIIILSRGNLTSELLDVIPPLKLPKESFLQYLPNLQKIAEAEVKAESVVKLNLQVKEGWKINESGPSFMNLLELVKDHQANLLASFDWSVVAKKKIELPKLAAQKNYVLQGVIYYCETKKNALCYVKSYEQKIKASGNSDKMEITLEVGK